MQKRIMTIIAALAVCFCLAACGAVDKAANEGAGEVDNAGAASSTETASYGEAAKGGQMRDFIAETINGDAFTLSDMNGKVIMLNFWATWCGPCVGEMPAFPRLAEKYGDDLVLIAVNVGDDKETTKAFLDKNGYTDLTVIVDEDYAISKLYPTDAIPYTVIIDRNGTISAIELGASGDVDEMFEKYSGLIDAAM